MENTKNRKQNQDNQDKGASCNATISLPFYIFLGLAAIIVIVLYFVI